MTSTGPATGSPQTIAARSMVSQPPVAAVPDDTGSATASPSPPEVPLASTLSASTMIGAEASE